MILLFSLHHEFNNVIMMKIVFILLHNLNFKITLINNIVINNVVDVTSLKLKKSKILIILFRKC